MLSWVWLLLAVLVFALTEEDQYPYLDILVHGWWWRMAGCNSPGFGWGSFLRYTAVQRKKAVHSGTSWHASLVLLSTIHRSMGLIVDSILFNFTLRRWCEESPKNKFVSRKGSLACDAHGVYWQVATKRYMAAKTIGIMKSRKFNVVNGKVMCELMNPSVYDIQPIRVWVSKLHKSRTLRMGSDRQRTWLAHLYWSETATIIRI